MNEATVERAVVDEVKKRGGVCWKWVSPGRAGVPDRIAILPGSRVIFVELKRPRRKDGRSPQQMKVFSILEKLGCEVWLINSADEFRRRLDNVMPYMF